MSAELFKQLADARTAFHSLKLTKTGMNKFAGYSYFELADFLVLGLRCMTDAGLCPVITFTPAMATMSVYSLNTGECIEFTSPMADAQLKGCHPIQNAGAVQTYQRRYLWMLALEIVAHDAIDSAKPVEPPKEIPLATDKQLAALNDYLDGGVMDGEQVNYFKKHGATLTEALAAKFIATLKNQAAES